MEKDTYSNINRKSKWLGIIDYKSIIILLAYIVIMWNVTGVFLTSVIYRVYIVIILVIPIVGLFYSYRSAEDVTSVIYTVLKYTVSPKKYVYKIESNKTLLK